MPLTSSGLKSQLKTKIVEQFGSVGGTPDISAEDAHDQFCEAIAKAVAAWIAANGVGAVTNVNGDTGIGNLTAQDNL